MKVKYHTKRKRKTNIKINHSTAHTLILITISKIYNPLNKIKFTKEKKNEKTIYTVLDFSKVKYNTKRKKKDKDKSLRNPQSKY